MDKEKVKKWIKKNVVLQDHAREITGQSVSAFNQSVQTGRIEPFVEFGYSRKIRWYLIEDLEHYADNKKGVKPMISDEVLNKIEVHRPHLKQMITTIRSAKGTQRAQLERHLADTYTRGNTSNLLSPSETWELTKLLKND